MCVLFELFTSLFSFSCTVFPPPLLLQIYTLCLPVLIIFSTSLYWGQCVCVCVCPMAGPLHTYVSSCNYQQHVSPPDKDAFQREGVSRPWKGVFYDKLSASFFQIFYIFYVDSIPFSRSPPSSLLLIFPSLCFNTLPFHHPLLFSPPLLLLCPCLHSHPSFSSSSLSEGGM